ERGRGGGGDEEAEQGELRHRPARDSKELFHRRPVHDSMISDGAHTRKCRRMLHDSSGGGFHQGADAPAGICRRPRAYTARPGAGRAVSKLISVDATPRQARYTPPRLALALQNECGSRERSYRPLRNDVNDTTSGDN